MLSVEKLEELKKSILELKQDTSKIILPGNKKIVISTSIFDQDNSKVSEDIKNYSGIKENEKNNSYLDALIKYYNLEYGINGVINYFPLQDKIYHNLSKAYIGSYYLDKDFRKYLKDVDALLYIHLKYAGYNFSNDVSVREGMSTFSFLGCSGISRELYKDYLLHDYDASICYGGTITKNEFLEEYEFTDDVITCCSEHDLGQSKYARVEKDKMWPRTLEVSFKSKKDMEELCDIFQILGDFLEKANKKFEEEDVYEVFSPMKVKK